MQMDDALLPWVYFNETIYQLLDDLKTLFPDSRTLNIVHGSLKIYTSAKRKMLQQMFLNTFAPYFDKILAHDETFFLERTADEYLDDFHRVYDDPRFNKDIEMMRSEMNIDTEKVLCANVVSFLRDRFRNLDSHNKDVIWKYMEQLIHLCEACVE